MSRSFQSLETLCNIWNFGSWMLIVASVTSHIAWNWWRKNHKVYFNQKGSNKHCSLSSILSLVQFHCLWNFPLYILLIKSIVPCKTNLNIPPSTNWHCLRLCEGVKVFYLIKIDYRELRCASGVVNKEMSSLWLMEFPWQWCRAR